MNQRKRKMQNNNNKNNNVNQRLFLIQFYNHFFLMKKNKPTLEEINSNLENELAKVKDMQMRFTEWSTNERQTLNQTRSSLLRVGKISLHELNDLIYIVDHYDASSETQKQFLENTLTLLSQK